MNTKKILTCLLCSAVVLSGVTGCTVKAKKPDATTVASETAEDDWDREIYGTYSIPDTARTNHVEMTVDSVEVVRWEQLDVFDRLVKSHNYIKVHVEITNLSDEDLDLQPKSIRGYIDNEQLSMVNNNSQAAETLGISGNIIEQATIHPGRSEKGYILYEYFRDWEEFEIQYKETSLDFGVQFDENYVVVKKTSTDPDVTFPDETAETSETSAGSEAPLVSIPGTGNTVPSSNGDTTSNVPTVTIPGASNTTDTTEPSTQPGGTDVPSITIPAPGGG